LQNGGSTNLQAIPLHLIGQLAEKQE